MATTFKNLAARFLETDDLAVVLRGAGLVLVIRTVGVALVYVSQIVIARWIGGVEYGIYAFAWAWAAILAIPAELGLTTGSLRFVPQYLASRDLAHLSGFLRRSHRLVLGTGVSITVAGVGVVLLAGRAIPEIYRLPLCLALCAVPLQALLVLQIQKGRAFGWIGLAYFPRSIAFPIALVAGVGAVRLAGVRVGANWALLAACLAAGAVLVAQVGALRSRVAPMVAGVRPRYDARNWLKISLPLLLVAGFQAALNHTDVVMLGSLRAPTDVGVYHAALKTAALISFVLIAVNALAAPKIAQLHAQGRVPELQGLVSGVEQWSFWCSLVGALGIVVLGRRLLSLFGPGFEAGYAILCILAAGQLINAAAGPVGYLLNMTGHQRSAALVFGVSALANIALNGSLIPLYGGIGAAVATAATMMMWNVWLWYLVKKRLGINSLILASRRHRER